jgi:tripartite-type tricarboxylate transporter receptor subunit TctC
MACQRPLISDEQRATSNEKRQKEELMKIACACLVAGLMVVTPGWGQDPAAKYPSRPVRWVIPFTPGASNDIIGRLVAGKLSEALGQQFIIDNRPGAGGIVGAETLSAEAQIKAGRIRMLAVAAKKRTAVMPHIPTLEEQGISNAEAIVWFGMSAPAKTPRPVLDKLNREVNKALQLADVRQRLDQLGLEVEGGTAEKFDAFIKSEAARLTGLIKAGAVQVE